MSGRARRAAALTLALASLAAFAADRALGPGEAAQVAASAAPASEGAGAAPQPTAGALGGDADFRAGPWPPVSGHARCGAIRPVALRRLAMAHELPEAAREAVIPARAAVDPGRDAPAAPRSRPRLVAPTAAAPARAAFRVSAEIVFTAPLGEAGPSRDPLLRRIGPDGRAMTPPPPVLGPVTGPGRMAEIVATVLRGQAAAPTRPASAMKPAT